MPLPSDLVRQYVLMRDDASDREQRQYALMRETLDGFRRGRSIGPVIADLEGLLHALEETPQDWKDLFLEQWGVLEIGYAVALDRQQPLPTALDHDIATALDGMDTLIAERTEDRA